LRPLLLFCADLDVVFPPTRPPDYAPWLPSLLEHAPSLPPPPPATLALVDTAMLIGGSLYYTGRFQRADACYSALDTLVTAVLPLVEPAVQAALLQRRASLRQFAALVLIKLLRMDDAEAQMLEAVRLLQSLGGRQWW
jgi:hypothetical protein